MHVELSTHPAGSSLNEFRQLDAVELSELSCDVNG
jgi:hypothetical protein